MKFHKVALIGSTLYMDEFHRQARLLNLKGEIALYIHVQKSKDQRDPAMTPARETMLTEMTRFLMGMANEVLVINVGGYIGESTRSHIEYATQKEIPIRFLESGR